MNNVKGLGERMKEIKRFAVLGGDLRSAHLAAALAAGGDFVYAAGFEHCVLPGMVQRCTVEEALAQCDAAVLPLPVSRDGVHLFAPFAAQDTELSDHLAQVLAEKPVFCGVRDSLPQRDTWATVRMIDYAAEEEFAVRNAVPTAEGAIQLALEESDFTLCGARCLVAGYGRIGQVLARLLKAFGAHVTVSARKARDLAAIEGLGMRAVETAHIRDSGEYDVIFNTIPSLVFDHNTLMQCAQHAILLELASAPYGIDANAAKQLNIPLVEAGGLPGKTAPRTAGEIIRRVILRYMRMLR